MRTKRDVYGEQQIGIRARRRGLHYNHCLVCRDKQFHLFGKAFKERRINRGFSPDQFPRKAGNAVLRGGGAGSPRRAYALESPELGDSGSDG